MGRIITYSLDTHRKIFAQPESNHDFFYVEVKEYPHIEEPYRSESYAIGLLRKGSIQMQAGLKKVVVTAPSMISMGPSVIRSYSKASNEMEMDIVFFKSPFFLENQANVFFLSKYGFFENTDSHAITLDKQQAVLFHEIFHLIKDTFQRKNAHCAAVIRSYLYALIFEIDALREVTPHPENQTNPLLGNFRQLLSKEFLRQRSVSFYADHLNVTRKYLSEIIKKLTGKTAGEWIDEAVILESKVLLQNKSLTINQISDQLNFSNQSVFGKFFKKSTGISPQDYRNNP